uniref:Uncharacterized protein n=1 Tax=Romanomermis culicivorax TaxID=13658 RepID=A0A915JCN1_ROMCU
FIIIVILTKITGEGCGAKGRRQKFENPKPDGWHYSSSSSLSDNIGSSLGKSRTRPPQGWILRRTSIFRDCGAVADGEGDAWMMLTSSLTGCSISPKVLAATVGELVARVEEGWWTIADSI